MSGYVRTIEIDAPPAAVWAVMSDVENWPDWTPTILKVVINGGGSLGAGGSAQVTPKGRPESEWHVTEYTPGRSFTWETAAGPGLRVAGGHVIEPADGGSRVTLSITAHGPAGPLMGWIVGRMSKSNVDIEAESLKRIVEQPAQERDA